MVGCNSTETSNIYPNLDDQQQFRLNTINEIKYDFVADIKERELMSKWLSKYMTSFDYFDKSLTVLSVTTGSILQHHLQLLSEHLYEYQVQVLVFHFQFLQEL